MTTWTEIVGPPGVGKTTLERALSDVRVPACDCDMSPLLDAIDREIHDWTGGDLVAKRLRGLRAVVETMPGTDRVIADGPIGWTGAVAARTSDRSAISRILVAMPRARVLHLTASSSAIVKRLLNRPDGAQRHIDKVAHYAAVASYVVALSDAHVTAIDTTDLLPEQVADAARNALAVPV